MHDPFHSGERAIQELTGERNAALRNGRLIADRIPAAAVAFVAHQRSCVLGWAAAEGELWAGFLMGQQGFARTDEERQSLYFRLNGDAVLPPGISAVAGVKEGDYLGALLIDFETRRRLRVNGRVQCCTDEEVAVAIDQTYPQCPKYIQTPRRKVGAPGPAMPAIREGEVLSAELMAWIAGAESFFVASAHPAGPMDVSHRGGEPGFIRFRGNALRIPDYAGNSMFSTLGNFALNPRAGLVFVDFEANRQLLMSGDVRLDFEAGCTARWWEFMPRKWIVSSFAAPHCAGIDAGG